MPDPRGAGAGPRKVLLISEIALQLPRQPAMFRRRCCRPWQSSKGCAGLRLDDSDNRPDGVVAGVARIPIAVFVCVELIRIGHVRTVVLIRDESVVVEVQGVAYGLDVVVSLLRFRRRRRSRRRDGFWSSASSRCNKDEQERHGPTTASHQPLHRGPPGSSVERHRVPHRHDLSRTCSPWSTVCRWRVVRRRTRSGPSRSR